MLTYKLQIASVMHIYPFISVAQLKPAPKNPDSFGQIRPTESPSVVEGGDIFEVEHILEQRVSQMKI